MGTIGDWVWRGGNDEGTLNSRLVSLATLISTLALLYLINGIYSRVVKPAYVSKLSRIPAAHWTAHFSSRWMANRREAGSESRTIYAAHQEYGPVVRLGPDEVSVMSVEGIKKIYGGGFERTRWFDEFKNYGTPNLLTLYGKEEHARRKRMVSNLFSKSFITGSPDFQTLSSVILWDRLLPVLGSVAANGGGIDFYKTAFALGTDFMSAYQFGIQNGYDLVSKGRETVRDAYLLNGARKLRGSEGPEKAKVAAEELEAQCMTMIETTREEMQGLQEQDTRADSLSKSTSPLAFANLSDCIFDQEKHLSMRDALKVVASEMLDNLEAAREGIGLALTYAAHELALHPHAQEALRDELRAAFADSAAVATQQFDAVALRRLDKLPWLDAIVNETLRLRPPGPGPQRRWVPRDGTVICGHYLPEKTTIHVSPYCIHRAPEAFPDAEVWRPERWLRTDDKPIAHATPKANERVVALQSYLFAFSSGGKTCLGNNFATMVTKLVLGLVHTNFKTHIIDDEGIEQVDEVLGWPRGGKLILGFEKV